MGKRLRKVAQRITRARIDFLRIQSNFVGVSQQLLESGACLFEGASAERKIFRLPEAANSECPFRRLSFVSVQQARGRTQMLINRIVGRAHTSAIGAFKSIPRQQKSTSIQVAAAKHADVRAQIS